MTTEAATAIRDWAVRELGAMRLVCLVYHDNVASIRVLEKCGMRLIGYEAALLYPAKVMAMTAIDLLFGEAEEAKQVIAKIRPAMTSEKYLHFLEEMAK